jgi:uncharacterized protein (TIGR03790 family)
MPGTEPPSRPGYVRRECPGPASLLRLAGLLTLIILWLATPRLALAGGGPENVLLVANSLREDSLSIANHYAALRQIPASNIVYLPWDGPVDAIHVDYLRERLLKPLFQEIASRRLERQIDYIVYSSGFPFLVDFKSDLAAPPAPMSGHQGSLTGLTYLSDFVRDRKASYVFVPPTSRSNFYFNGLTRGFSSQYGWLPTGQRADGQGNRYYLSTMLGYTDGRGNSLEEVLNYLRRAAMADGTTPDGNVYLMRVEGQVRSMARHDAFNAVKAELTSLGVKAEIVQGALPFNSQKVMGAVVGMAGFEWTRYQCRMRPGAICEHLTSFGGDLRSSANQTPLSEFLRYGAAGSSGTVVEPYALQDKFPHPWIHVHYARGASLAEAFYQSVASPYQLLIVGDPLCRPWARIPRVRLQGLDLAKPVSGTQLLTPEADAEVPVKAFRLFVDGRLLEEVTPGGTFQLDTSKLADGYHELRLVGIEDSAIESQGREVLPLEVNNRGRRIEWAVQPPRTHRAGQFRMLVNAPGASSILVFHNRRQIGKIQGESGSLTVEAQGLGSGPVVLTAVAVGNSPADKVFSRPIAVVVEGAADLTLPTSRERSP